MIVVEREGGPIGPPSLQGSETMKNYRYVRGLEGSPEGTVRKLSEQDAAPLIKSGAIVAADDDDADVLGTGPTHAAQSLLDHNERLNADLNDAVQARDAAIGQRDAAIADRDSVIVERDLARKDLESASALLSDTSQVDQLRADLDAAVKRGDQAEADLLVLKTPPPAAEGSADDTGTSKPAKPAK
ncbi:hypothetical protein [Sphingomonas faeni]|uniref:hypothetical protein n=1 Tax=Sphingomonas faeni TaxID=185950 RepID=UPI0033563BCE